MKKLLWLLLTIAIIASGIYLFNYFTLIQPTTSKIKEDSRNDGISIEIHYKYYVLLNTLVFDLKSISPDKAATDVFRVFLQSASCLKNKRVHKVELCFKGTPKFTITGEYFNTLGNEFGEQNPIYTMRTFPENLFKTNGEAAYSKWSGGMLGVLGQQMDDFNDFNKKWYLEEMVNDASRITRQEKEGDSIKEANGFETREKELLLQDSLNKIKERKKEEGLKLFDYYVSKNKNKFRIKKDEINESTKYFDPSSPRYVNDFSSLYCHLYENKYLVDCIININYVAEDWLFIKRYVIKTDNKTYEISPEGTDYDKVNTDNQGGQIFEWYSFGIDDERLKMLEDIISSKKVILRMIGSQYDKDRLITDREKKALSNMIAAWKIANPE